MAERTTNTPDVRLKVEGVDYGGWMSMRVQRGIEQASGAFELGVSELWPGQDTSRRIRAGDECTLAVDGQVVITGYVDDVSVSQDASSHQVLVSGRDRTADLIDCSAMRPTGQWSGRKIEQIASDLAAPFGIKVRADVDTGAAFSGFALQQGETAFEAIERLARIRALLVMSDGAGNLVLTRSGIERVGVRLVMGDNILRVSGSISMRERYSDYILKGQGPGNDYFSGKAASQVQSSAKDPAVRRYRPLLVVAESAGTLATLAQRAQWEATVRAARATDINVTVQGWSHAGGLWKPNTIVPIKVPALEIDDELLISSVSQSLDESGSTTDLALTRRDTYKLLPLKDPGTSAPYWAGTPKGTP